MEQILSREEFWIDKTLMADFLKEPLNQKLFDVLLNVKRKTPSQDYHTLQLFNEVYYLCSLIVLEDNPKMGLSDYIEIIKKDMGWNYPSSIVVNMIYAVLSLRKDNSKAVRHLLATIQKHYKLEEYKTPFSLFVKESESRGESYDITFKRNKMKITSLRDLQEKIGKPIIININNAEINVNSGGNIIGKEIKYGTNG